MSKVLMEQLRKKQEEDRKQVEELTSKNLQTLSENLVSAVEKELSSIEKNIGQQAGAIRSSLKSIKEEVKEVKALTDSLSRLTLKPFLSALATILLILTIICGGSWGAMRYLSTEILTRASALEKLSSLTGVEEVVKNQIWLQKKPKVFQAEKGFWVVETQ